jgi:hypothetical protein
MRLTLALAVLTLFAVQAQALATTPATPQHHRTTWEQRFTQANTTHDGHLTLDQAKAGHFSIARHFAAMDKGNKGYVTQDDVRAYHKAQHAAHHQSATPRNHPST